MLMQRNIDTRISGPAHVRFQAQTLIQSPYTEGGTSMAISSRLKVSTRQSTSEWRGESSQVEQASDHQLNRWGGIAGLAGVILMLAAGVVVGAFGLPDASDVETLRDFADIESGRIFEHFFYLGAVMMFALHVLVLYQMLRTAHPAAALFGAAMALFGFVIMAASSLLHVATSPLAELYTAPDTPPEDLRAIEYAWYGAQSVFDTMLATGVLLVPIGIVLLGIAMRSAAAFGSRLSTFSILLGVVGVIGAVIAIVDPGSAFAAASVLTIVAFHLSTGWRTLALGKTQSTDRDART